MPITRYTREELYELVWSVSMLRLSKRFGLSDVGLAKTCRKHDIPLPPPGYWAKVRAGQTPPKTPLPKSEATDRIRLNQLSDAELESKRLADASAEAKVPIIITVSETLRGAHPVVSDARKMLEQGKPEDSGIIALPKNTELNISVSRSQSHRCLRIIDAILKHAVSEKHQVTSGPAIVLFGETVPFGIKESTIAINEELTNIDLNGEYNFFHSRYKTRHKPDGALTLFIDVDSYQVSRIRRQWKDTDKQKIEDCLGKFYQGVMDVATQLRQRTEEKQREDIAQEERRKQREVQEQHWSEIRKQQAVEQNRLDKLLEQVKCYKLAADIREFVEAKRLVGLGHATSSGAAEEIERWAQWALQQAERLDPTRPSPTSVLDEYVPEVRRW